MEDISDQVTWLSARVGEAFEMLNDKLMQINDEVEESKGVNDRVMAIVDDTNEMVNDLSTIVENDLASKNMLDDAASNLSKELRKINQTLDETEASKVLNDASNSLFASIQNHMTPSSRSANEILATRTIEQRKKIAELEQQLKAIQKKPLSVKKRHFLKKALRVLEAKNATKRTVQRQLFEPAGSGSGEKKGGTAKILGACNRTQLNTPHQPQKAFATLANVSPNVEAIATQLRNNSNPNPNSIISQLTEIKKGVTTLPS